MAVEVYTDDTLARTAERTDEMMFMRSDPSRTGPDGKALKLIILDAIDTFINRFVRPLIQAEAATLEEIRNALNTAVEDWARADLTPKVKIPFDQLDAQSVKRWLDRQTSYQREDEVLVTPVGHVFSERQATTVTFDAGKKRPTAGLIFVTISDSNDSKTFTIDASALNALMNGTASQNWRDSDDPPPPNSFLRFDNVISSDEDGNYDTGVIVGKNDTGPDNFLIFQSLGDVGLDRTIGITALEYLPWTYDEELQDNTLKFYKQVGANKFIKSLLLPTHTPITPATTRLDPPDIFFQSTLTVSANWLGDAHANETPTEGPWEALIGDDEVIVRGDALTFENVRSKTPSTVGESTGTTDDNYRVKIPGYNIWVGIDSDGELDVYSQVATKFKIRDYWKIRTEDPTTFFEKSFVIGSGNRNRWQGDEDGHAYSRADGEVDVIVNDVKIARILPNNIDNIAIRVAGTLRTSGGIEDSEWGYIAVDSHTDGEIDWLYSPLDDENTLPDGTEVNLVIKEPSVQYVQSNQFSHLFFGLLLAHPALFGDGDSFRAAWRSVDMDAGVQASLRKADNTLDYTRDSSLKVGEGQIPYPNVEHISTVAEFNANYDGITFLFVDSDITVSGTTYPAGSVVVCTGETTRQDITDHIETHLSNLPVGTSVDSILVRGGTPEQTFKISVAGLRLLMESGALKIASSFNPSPIDGEYHVQDSDTSGLSYLDGNGAEQTDAVPWDTFRYSTVDNRWHFVQGLPKFKSWAGLDSTEEIDRSQIPGPIEYAVTLPAVGDRNTGALCKVQGLLYELSDLSGSKRWVEAHENLQKVGQDDYPAQVEATYVSGSTRQYQVNEVVSDVPDYFRIIFDQNNWVDLPRTRPRSGPTKSQSYLPAYCVDSAGNRINFPGGLNHVIYYPPDHSDPTLADNVRISWFGDRKAGFMPQHFLFYHLTQSRSTQRDYPLVDWESSNAYSRTARALEAQDKPIDGNGNRRTISGWAELKNISGEYLTLRGGSETAKYSVTIGRDVRWRKIYEMSANDFALVRNWLDNAWAGDQFHNPLNIASLPDGALLRFGLKQGTVTRLFRTHLSVLTDEIKGMTRMGSTAPNFSDDRRFNAGGIPELALRDGFELLDPSQSLLNIAPNVNAWRLQITGQSRWWGCVWVGNGNLYVGTDHASYWTASSQFIVEALGI